MKIRYSWLLSSMVLLASCQDEESVQSIAPNEVENITEEVQIEECIRNQNLILNPQFGVLPGEALPENWRAVQHSGEPSFEINIDSGALTITKIATQPWFTFVQQIDVKSWVGRKMRYSAEVKLDLNDNNLTHQFEPGGGLYLLVYGDNDPIGGDRLLLNLNLKHEPKLGATDWKHVNVDFTVPEEPTRMIVGFMHQANGTMAARNPVLDFCGE